MGFDMLIGTSGGHVSPMPGVGEMDPFDRWEPVSQAPQGCCLFSNSQRPSSSPGWAHLCIFGLPLGVWGPGVSFGPDGTCTVTQTSGASFVLYVLL